MIELYGYHYRPQNESIRCSEKLDPLLRISMLTSAIFLAYNFPIVVIGGFLLLSAKAIYNATPLRNRVCVEFNDYTSFNNFTSYCERPRSYPRYFYSRFARSPFNSRFSNRVPVRSQFYTHYRW
jgi:hypothetical protein